MAGKNKKPAKEHEAKKAEKPVATPRQETMAQKYADVYFNGRFITQTKGADMGLPIWGRMPFSDWTAREAGAD